MPVPAGPSAAVTLDDVKAQLNIKPADTSDDTELQGFLDDALEWVETQVGPLDAGTSYTADIPGGSRTLTLPVYPVISVETIEEYPWRSTAGIAPTLTTVDPYVYSVDPATGIVTRTDGCCFRPRLRVTYTAGRSTVPGPLRRAVLLMVQHMWETQRGPDAPRMSSPMDPEEGGYVSGFGYAIPRRVAELIEPYRLAPVVA